MPPRSYASQGGRIGIHSSNRDQEDLPVMLFSSIIYGSQEAKRWDTSDPQQVLKIEEHRYSFARLDTVTPIDPHRVVLLFRFARYWRHQCPPTLGRASIWRAKPPSRRSETSRYRKRVNAPQLQKCRAAADRVAKAHRN